MNTKSILLRSSVICTILVVIGLFDLPYGYYMFLRLCLCGTAVAVIYFAFDSLHEVSRWLFGAIAVLYNPIIPIYLNDKSVWIVLNVITLVVFWATLGMVYQVRINRLGNEGLPKTGRRDERTVDGVEAARSDFDAAGSLIKLTEATDDEEIEYYEAINDFITSHGFYEPFLELQGTDKEYCIASMKMHKAAYLSDQSEKVIGALTLDSVRLYEKSRLRSILFLQSLEENYLNDEEDDVDDYHPALDKAASEATTFLKSKNMYVPLRGNGTAINISSELLVYIASYLAMLDSGENLAAVSWNSFKACIENRILGTLENPPSLSDSVVTPESKTFVHYTSEYFTEMTRMEGLVLNNKTESGELKLQPLVSSILRKLGSDNPEHQSQLQDYLAEVSRFASKEIIPKVVRVFG